MHAFNATNYPGIHFVHNFTKRMSVYVGKLSDNFIFGARDDYYAQIA